MIISSLLFAMMGVCVRFASSTVPVTEIILFRSVIGLFLIIPIMLIKKASFIGNRPRVLLVRGLTGFCALSLYFLAISRIPLATAVMLNYTSPLFVALMAPFILKEKFNGKIFSLILLGFTGVGLIVHPSSHMDFSGSFIALISGIFASFAYISIGALRQDHSSLTIVSYFFTVSSVLSIPIAWTTFKIPTRLEFLYLAGTGVFATIAQIFMTRAYRIGSTSATSAYASTIVLFSLFFGMVFWRENPTLMTLIGGILVVISVVLVARIEKQELSAAEV